MTGERISHPTATLPQGGWRDIQYPGVLKILIADINRQGTAIMHSVLNADVTGS